MDVSHTANYRCAVSGACMCEESDILRPKHPSPHCGISTLADKNSFMSN